MTHEEHKTLTYKLFEIRKEIKPMKKDQKGYNYKYFDINQMIEVLQPLFEKYKILVLQPLTHIGERMSLTTLIMDTESSERVEIETPLIELQDPQKMGGCITYFRRYALQSLFFMEAEDDDASEATKSVKTYPTKTAYIPVANRFPTRPSETKIVPDNGTEPF